MKLTIEELEAMGPCSNGMEWARKQKNPHDAWEGCNRADWMIWFLRRKSLLTKPVAVEFAIACAERVIGLYETKYPADKRPRQAIEAAKSWLADPSEENRKAAYPAAAAAYAVAADYAAATAAAAAAAYAATAATTAAAYAAAYAADDATAAADAAADAADADAAADARAKEQKWQANKLRSLVQNPFDK